jgi:hypothetical protein
MRKLLNIEKKQEIWEIQDRTREDEESLDKMMEWGNKRNEV